MIIACFLLFAVVQFEESQKSEEGFWRSLASALEGKYHVTNMEYMDVTQMSVSEQAYQKLPNRLKKAYRQLDEYVYKFYDNIDDIVIPKDDFQKVLSYYRADHPQAFWVSSAYRYQYEDVYKRQLLHRRSHKSKLPCSGRSPPRPEVCVLPYRS